MILTRFASTEALQRMKIVTILQIYTCPLIAKITIFEQHVPVFGIALFRRQLSVAVT